MLEILLQVLDLWPVQPAIPVADPGCDHAPLSDQRFGCVIARFPFALIWKRDSLGDPRCFAPVAVHTFQVVNVKDSTTSLRD